MIFAKVDVCLPTHPKFVKAGPAAVGYWVAALAYSRGHDLSGFVPEESVGVLLGLGEREGRKLADRLVEVGLFEPREGGYHIVNYEQKNETKEQTAARRAATRERVDIHRKRKAEEAGRNAGGNAVTDPVTNNTGTLFVPGSGSASGSGSVSPEIAPASGPLPRSMVAVEKAYWIAAYERAVDAARRPKATIPYTFKAAAIGALVSIVEKHCTGEHRQDISAWVERAVTAFVRAVDGLGEDISKAWSSYGPDGLQKWFNNGKPGYRAPADARPRPTPAPERPLTPAERTEAQAKSEEIARMLGSFGKAPDAPKTSPTPEVPGGG